MCAYRVMSQSLSSQLNKPENVHLALKKLSIVVSLLLTILCAHVLFQFAEILFAEKKPASTVKNVPPPIVSDVNNQQAFKKLTQANIFGASSKKKIKIIKVKETKLNLVLKGVFANTPMINSTAIIASGKNGKENHYDIGDKFPDGVVIAEIHSDHVILERRGQFEILRMPESKDVGEIVSVIPDLRGVRPIVSDEVLDVIRNKIIANPESLRDYALPVVVKKNKKQIGYRLKPQQKGGILYDIGIEPEDIVTAVNDVALSNPKNATKALMELITAKNVFITVMRGDNELKIKVELQ